MFAIFLSPLFSHKLGIPVVVIEVVIGIIIGRSFLNIIPPDPWLQFFSYFGLIYLLFLAGLEINFGEIREKLLPVVSVALSSLFIPFLLGYLTALTIVEVNPLFLGVILSTTSLGVVLPLSKEIRRHETFTHLLLGSVVLVDVFSMFLLAASIQLILGRPFELFIYSTFFILLLFTLPVFFNRFELGRKVRSCCGGPSYFHFEVRFCFALIAGLALLAEVIGFHAIIGAFIAGLAISELTWRGSELEQNLISFGYGFFIPLFFIMVGVNTNLPLLLGSIKNLLVLLVITLVGIFGKVFGIFPLSKIFGLSFREGVSLGFIESARLSLILAGAEIGRSLGIIDEAIFSTLVIFSIISVLVGPSVGKFLLKEKGEKS